MAKLISTALLVSTIMLLFAAWLMMVISISMPDWSTSEGHYRVGLWDTCLYLPAPVDGWKCGSIDGNLKDNAYMVTCRVTSIMGVICTFLANVAVCGMFTAARFIGPCALCLTVFSFILNSIAWGTWIGVHNDLSTAATMLFSLKLASSFIMCCVAAGFCFLSIYLIIAAMLFLRKDRPGVDAFAKEYELEFQPGYDQQGQYGYGAGYMGAPHAHPGEVAYYAQPNNSPATDLSYPVYTGSPLAAPVNDIAYPAYPNYTP